jgi:hypothetical protein
MPMLKTKPPAAVDALSLTSLTAHPDLAPHEAKRIALLKCDAQLDQAIRERRGALQAEHDASMRQLQQMGIQVDLDAPWTPDPQQDSALLNLLAERQAGQRALLDVQQAMDALVPRLRAELLAAFAAEQLGLQQDIIHGLREVKAKAQRAFELSQHSYGTLQDFLGNSRLLYALSTYDLTPWESELPRLRRLTEGDHHA